MGIKTQVGDVALMDHDMPLIRLGIVGACGRGGAFKRACEMVGRITVAAVCDVNAKALDDAARTLNAKSQYTDFHRMLDEAKLDAVLVATPMPLHVSQSIAALDRDIHVLSEVPAAVNVDEARLLVLAAHRSKATYMMAENYTFLKPNVMIREMVRQGAFGKTYYAQGEYIHQLRDFNPTGSWRRHWQTGTNGITYGTHSLGPILQWMPNDRVTAVSCIGAGQHHRDDAGQYFENEATCTMTCRMRHGGMAQVRVDMLSDRPHAMNNYQLQGIDGCYESARVPGQSGRVWLRDYCDQQQWLELDDTQLVEAFLTDDWKRSLDFASRMGHGGGDFFELMEFVDVIAGKRQPSVGIHQAMDMTLPGLMSQKSIAADGQWVNVPDSRTWVTDQSPKPQLRMTYPTSEQLVIPDLPAGYTLRQITDEDLPAYMALMDQVGFCSWSKQFARDVLASTLPGGAFVIAYQVTGELCATALAQHAHHAEHPNGGQLGWVAAAPNHRGKALGRIVCAAATKRLVDAGYTDIFLLTDDHRLPAIAPYLKLGYIPVTHHSDMTARWQKVRAALAR